MKTESGLHTFEVFTKINKHIFDELHKLFKIYVREKRCCFIPYPDDQRWNEMKKENKANRRSWTLYLNETGLNISLLKTYYTNIYDESSQCKNYYLRYIISPYHLLNNNHFNIYTEDKFHEVCDRVDKIRRIDLCRNIALDNSNEVRLYIDLLKKYDGYKKFKLIFVQDKDGIDYPHEVSTTLRNRDIEICAYDKHFEMSSKSKTYTESETESYRTVLRVELRVEKEKVLKRR